MGKRSVRENKTVYQQLREEAGLTREKASELMDFISADRIEKIESEKSQPHPEEILAMSDAYKKPLLCNYYCSQQCPIGREYVPPLEQKDLSQIVLELLNHLNEIEKERDRIIEITHDGEISEDEYAPFAAISQKLERISVTSQALQLWVRSKIVDGLIDKEKLEEASRES